ncbi:MAG: ATP-binding protein, partial [Chromatiales bacterium]|nr:ATP-binding protein [Chromatiales bacterium]
TGYDSDEVIGRSVWDVVIPPEQKDQVMMIFESLRKGSFEVPSLYENEWMTRNGGRRLLRWSNSVLHNEQNDISHIIALGYDITEQRKAEDEHQRTQMELQQAQKMESLGHLTGGIAHDFNNLLGIINGYSELAQLKSAATEDVKLAEYINHIRDAGNRAAKLVAQMLAFSRRDATEKTPTNMGSLLSEDINLLRATLPSTITIESYIEEKLPPVSINTTQFNQMLMNLAVNARDAMDGKGRLTIGLRLLHNLDTSSSISHKPVKGEWIELSVSDSGCGIHSNIVPNIFNPFFTTKEVGKGTGMGLSVIYRIMENLGGHIMLDTELGKGSNFRLLFPPVTALNQNIATTTDNTAQYSGEGQEILIIDDEEALAIYLSERLRDAGYRPTHTASAMEAMEMFMQQPERFSVVITDQTMPGMTGSELIGRFREIHPELPAIICSGYSEKINAESAKELAIAYFEKPVEINRLLKKIYEVLH